MKLSLCMIVKNEAENLPKLFKSVEGVFDEYVITDTGSTDNTKQVCEELLKEKLNWSTFEWCDDFSKARNYNFSQATGDWLVWADADDTILNAKELREIAESCEKDNVNSVVFPYHYVRDENGNTLALQYRERLVKKGTDYKWIGRLHEAMLPVTQMARALKLESVVWMHEATRERSDASRWRNLEILKSALSEEIAKNAVDPRTVFNLGNAFFSVQDYPNALGCYLKYIPQSGWREERYLARHRSSLALLEMGKNQEALEAAFTAIQEIPEYPDAYIDLGKAYFELQDFEKSLYWLKESRTKEYPRNLPVFNPLDYTANVAWLIGHCYVQMAEYKKARPYFEEFKKYYPKNEQVADILKLIDDGAKEAEVARSVAIVGDYLQDEKFWDMLPLKLLDYPEILHTKNKRVRKTESTGKDLVIYCGMCIVPWDPSCEEKGGIGGSEEAVINMARLMQKRGWNVTVYGKPMEEKRLAVFDGVEYRHYSDFNPNDKCDVFISWRMPSVMNVKINAAKKYIWLHDCTPEDSFSPEILNNTTGIFVLSKYHRSLYPRIPDDKFVYFGNGLNPAQFTEPVEKDPMYCLNTSAPDRGLQVLLEMWPKIREKVPNASLKWFYGWETFDELHKGNKEKMAWKENLLTLLRQPGVEDCGRVDHKAIAKEYQKAQLWLYPTEFTETYCISAAKAQAAGALPVCTNVAALDETVQYGTKLVYNNIYTNQQAQQQFVDTVSGYLLNPDTVSLERAGMSEWALNHFDWSHMADVWESQFK